MVDRQLELEGQQLELRQRWGAVSFLVGAEDALGHAHCPGTFLRSAPCSQARITDQDSKLLGPQGDLGRGIHASSRRLRSGNIPSVEQEQAIRLVLSL